MEKVSFRTYRHWKATVEYHWTKDSLFVKHVLGHKTLESTTVYIDIEKAIYGSGRDDDYTVRVAETIEEDTELIEAGFERVTDRDDMKITGSENRVKGYTSKDNRFTSKLYLMERTVLFYEFHQNWRNSLDKPRRRRDEQI